MPALLAVCHLLGRGGSLSQALYRGGSGSTYKGICYLIICLQVHIRICGQFVRTKIIYDRIAKSDMSSLHRVRGRNISKGNFSLVVT